MSMSTPASESEIWTLRQCLLKTKSAMFSLQSQLYKSRASYEKRAHTLTLQLNSLKAENYSLKVLLDKCQDDLEAFRKKVTYSLEIFLYRELCVFVSLFK